MFNIKNIIPVAKYGNPFMAIVAVCELRLMNNPTSWRGSKMNSSETTTPHSNEEINISLRAALTLCQAEMP